MAAARLEVARLVAARLAEGQAAVARPERDSRQEMGVPRARYIRVAGARCTRVAGARCNREAGAVRLERGNRRGMGVLQAPRTREVACTQEVLGPQAAGMPAVLQVLAVLAGALSGRGRRRTPDRPGLKVESGTAA